MSVSSPFIQRPIATSLLGVAVMLGGFLGYWWLPVSALPQVDFPTIQVTTQLPGANPDTIAALVTAPLERQFGQIPALQSMTSSSSFGISQVTLQFDLNRDIDAAAQDVQSAINAAASTLPRNLPYPPLYSKVNPADFANHHARFDVTEHRPAQLSDMADTIMAPRLSEVTGVGHVSVQGGIRPAIRIQAGPSRLAAYGIAWTMCEPPSSAPTSPGLKARSTARTSPTPSRPMIRSPPASGQDLLRRANWWIDYRGASLVVDADGALGDGDLGERLTVDWHDYRPAIDTLLPDQGRLRLVLDSAASSPVLFPRPEAGAAPRGRGSADADDPRRARPPWPWLPSARCARGAPPSRA